MATKTNVIVDVIDSSGSSQELENADLNLPKTASSWDSEHDAEQLGILYREKSYAEILDRVEFDGGAKGLSHFKQMVKSFRGLMDAVFSCEPEEQANLIEIIASPVKGNVSVDDTGDVLFLERLQSRVKDCHRNLYLCAEDIAKSTGISKHAFIPTVLDFLSEFRIMLVEAARGRPPTDRSFESLFVSFGKIFAIPFRSGGARQTRSMDIFGQTVKCQPDLLYEYRASQDGGGPVSIVTVAEVKKLAPLASEEVVSNHNLGSECEKASVASDSTTPPKRMKMDNCGLPNTIRGQHAAELLLELENSAHEVSEDGKRHMLGLIVQATKVRLTCMEITNEHFQQLRAAVFHPIVGKKAFIYFSEAYDMFIKEDRKDLVYIMMALGTMGRKHTFNILPSIILEGYLL